MSDTHATGDTPNAAPFAVKYGDWQLTVDELPAEAVKYLLQNGFSQSMVDAAALSAKEKEGKSTAEVEAIVLEKRTVPR